MLKARSLSVETTLGGSCKRPLEVRAALTARQPHAMLAQASTQMIVIVAAAVLPRQKWPAVRAVRPLLKSATVPPDQTPCATPWPIQSITPPSQTVSLRLP
jgi:nitrous oxidase accessory protein NosD